MEAPPIDQHLLLTTQATCFVGTPKQHLLYLGLVFELAFQYHNPLSLPQFVPITTDGKLVGLVITQTISWENPDLIHKMEIMVGDFTHCHLR